MKRQVWVWQLMGFAVTSFLGTVLHFLYEWCGECPLIAPISGVNESTWEHIKLLFWPMLIYAGVESFFFKSIRSFWSIKLRGILIGCALIPIIFYTYGGVIGKSPDWVNISIFFVAAAAAYIYEWRAILKNEKSKIREWVAIASLAVIAILFVIFSYAPPKIGIFLDPLTGEYGR